MKKGKKFLSLVMAFLLLFGLTGCAVLEELLEEPAPSQIQNAHSTGKPTKNIPNNETQTGTKQAPETKGNLTVHFIDVGQADSILIKQNGEAMLIDAGNNDDEETVLAYLKAQKVEKLKYVVGTHPHEDHIGALDGVINHMEVSNVLLPDKTSTTKTFSNLIQAIEKKDLEITVPEVGETYKLGDATFTILGPGKDYGDDINSWSICLRLVFGDTSFVLTGDAEKEAETQMLGYGLPLSADVFKCGHHGSSTSNSESFLRAVSPKYVVISCGKNNDYGHPHRETLETLKKMNLSASRTDMEGSIVFESNGKKVTPLSHQDNTPIQKDDEAAYILNTKTKKFHLPSCKNAQDIKSENRKEFEGSRQSLLDEGYDPCGLCKP